MYTVEHASKHTFNLLKVYMCVHAGTPTSMCTNAMGVKCVKMCSDTDVTFETFQDVHFCTNMLISYITLFVTIYIDVVTGNAFLHLIQ